MPKTKLDDILVNGSSFQYRTVSKKEWKDRFKRVKRLQEKGTKRKHVDVKTLEKIRFTL